MNLQNIRFVCKTYPGGLKRLAQEVEMQPQSIQRSITSNEIRASNVEKIARALGVPVQLFFDEDVQVCGSQNNNAAIGRDRNGNMCQTADINTEKIQFLEKLLAEKDNIIAKNEALIAEKERLIQFLMAQKS